MKGAVAFALRGLVREARAGELLVLFAALTVAVGSLTAIGFLTDRIAQAVARQAAEVLAADIRLRAARPLDAEWPARGEAAGLATAETVTFPSVVFFGENSALGTVKAVSPGYPLRGEVRIAPALFADPVTANGIPPRGEIWADTALLARLGASAGDTVDIGASRFTVGAVLTYRPDQTPGFAGLAPSFVMNLADLEATGLVRTGSRVSYAQLYAGPREALAEFRAALEDELPEEVRLEDRGDAGQQLNSAIERAGRFLALASLVSLILAAVAVAMAARRYADRRMDTVALMKCLGASQRYVFTMSLVQVLTIAVSAGLAGAAVGFLAERGLSGLLAGLIGGELPPPSLTPVWLGLGTALILMAGLALPPLWRLKSTPPLRVLRRTLTPPPLGAWLTFGAALAALALMIFWAVRDAGLLAVILGGTAAFALVLYLAGLGMVKLLGRLRGRVGVAWRYGLANVARRGSDSAVQVVAFGLGLMVLLLLTLVRNDLLAGWRASLDEDVPNQFLINIQPDEVEGVSAIIADAGLEVPEFVPLVRARMTHIDDVPVTERDYPTERGPGFVRREANLTYTGELGGSNRVVAGEWWSGGYDGPPLVSVDVEVAEDLGLALGDRLRFVVAGETLEAEIASLREIEWDSFEPNFFMVFSPAALEGYPKTFVTSLLVPAERREVLLRVVRSHPSVSVIDIEAVLTQVRRVIDRAALAVQYVFLFTLAAGLVVLFAAVQTTLDQRRYESALLRTFGARRSTVLSGVVSEFAALGLAAGVFAAIGATIIGSLAARELFGLDYGFDWTLWVAGIAAGVVVVGASGTLAARGAVDTPPVRTLRRA